MAENLNWIENNKELFKFEQRPYPNEHSARLVDPKIQHKRVRRTKGSGEGAVQGLKIPESIAAIWYIIESNGKEIPVTQALRFPVEKWSVSQAKDWLKDNKIKYILFEPAEEKKENTTKNDTEMKTAEYRFGELRTIPKDVEENRTVQFVVSDGTKDRHNSILNPDGWDLKAYKKNPIVGYQHQVYSGFFKETNPDGVIGTAKVSREDDNLIADIQFEPAEINPLAEKIFRKILHGTIRATSVGFYPKKSHEGDPEKDEEKDVRYYDEQELVEISVVNVPSNPNAVKRANSEDKIELINYILTEALGDKFNEKLTIKGVFSVLRGENIEPDKDVKFPNRLVIAENLLKIKKNGTLIIEKPL